MAAAVAFAAAPAASAWQVPDPSASSSPSAQGFDGSGPDLTDIVRATPTHDVSPAAAQDGDTYATAGNDTGTVPAIAMNRKDQPASSIQIRLPILTGPIHDGTRKQLATFAPGDQLKLTLPQGVSFARTPTVSAIGVVDLAELSAHSAPESIVTAELVADDGSPVALDVPQTRVTLSADSTVVTIQFTSNQWGYGPSETGYTAKWLNLRSATFTDSPAAPAAPTYPETSDAPRTQRAATSAAAGTPTAAPGFLLTVGNVRLTAGPDALGGPVTVTVTGERTNGLYPGATYATYPAKAPAACTVGTIGGTRNVSFVGGSTTVAYLPQITASVRQVALMATLRAQQLPRITFGETTPSGWKPGATYRITGTVTSAAGATLGAARFDLPVHAPPIQYLDVVSTSPASLTVSNFGPAASQYGVGITTQLSFAVAAADNAAVESLELSGLRITGYAPSGGGSTPMALPPGASVTIKLAPRTATATAVNNASTVGCVTRVGDSEFSHTGGPAAVIAATATLPVAQTVNRIGGLDRYDTAARLAMRFADTQGGTTNAVVIANGETFKQGFDALSANFLAGQANAPILLTQADSLPRETARALRSVLNGVASPTVYVMGGFGVVSGATEHRIRVVAEDAATGTVTVTRVAGENRYSTSVAAARTGAQIGGIASLSFAQGQPNRTSAILASGEVNADALAAGALSNALGLPILLTTAGDIPPSVVSAIKDLGIKQLFVLGGSGRITSEVIAEARAAMTADGTDTVVAKRISGANRFDTAVELYDFAGRSAATPAGDGGGLGWASGATVYLANGYSGFPDALSVGPLAASSNSPLLTTENDRLPSSVSAFLSDYAGSLQAAIAIGGPQVVNLSVVRKANAAL